MRNRLKFLIAPLWAILILLAATASAQTTGKQPKALSAGDARAAANRDLSGVWEMAHVKGQGILGVYSEPMPPLTPWGKEKYDAAKPGYGPRAAPGGNDPSLSCSPAGIPRVMLMDMLPFEIVQTSDRVFVFFEWQHLWRQIWLNRSEHAKDVSDTWMGDSIGHWEGNTLVVDSIGFNDRTWLDHNGDPHSDEMHLTERYERVDQNTLKVNYIIDDPKTYTHPWVSDSKLYQLMPKEERKIEELFCVPEDEDAFTRRIRMPAAAPPKN
jgi:hypothetical protein